MEWQPTLWKVTRKDDEMAERDLESMNIYQKLAEIRRPVEVIKKNRKGFGYTYADEEEILSKISGLMRKYNISLIPGIVPGTTKVAPYQYEKTKFTKDGTQYNEKVSGNYLSITDPAVASELLNALKTQVLPGIIFV